MSTFFLFFFLFTGAQLVFKKREEAIKPEERWYRPYRDRGDELSREESLHETRTHSHKAEVDTHPTDIRVKQFKQRQKKR